MNFLKKILVAIILITVIAASVTLVARQEEVDNSSAVEIVLDGQSYTELKSMAPELTLSQLKDRGISALAIYQQSLEDFEENGSLTRIEALDLLLAADLEAELRQKNITENNFSNSALFAVFNDSLQKQLNLIAGDLRQNYGAEIFSAADLDFLYFPHWNQRLEDLSLGYSSALVKEAQAAGLKLVYRSGNKLNALSVLKNNLAELNADLIIFDGEEVTGYPEDIEKTAALLNENQLSYGIIEAFIADQAGADKLTELIDYNILRTHSMQQEEIENADNEEIINRYLLSVRERSVRVIYHKAYLKGEQLLERNFGLLSELNSHLKNEGFSIAKAEAVPYFSNSTAHLFAILMGLTAAAVLLLNYFSFFKFSKILNLLFPISAALAFVLIRAGSIILLRQIIALGAAVIFPSLAVIVFLLEKKQGGEELEGGLKLFYILSNFTAAVLTALIGGLFVSSALNSSQFIFKVADFRGVKLAFLLPLVIISLYYLIQLGQRQLKADIALFLDSPIRIKDLILGGILALIAVIYIGRTGNFPLLPVPDWERTVRKLLEQLLYVRPRFKEFLIGHPLFIFSLYLAAAKRKKLFFYPILMLASVGVITTVNTFSHLHTPIIISVLRTFHGYWVSFLVAAVIIATYLLFNFLYQNYYQSGVKR